MEKKLKGILPIQAGDVENTYADMSDISKDFNFKPKVSIEEGVKEFVIGIRILQIKRQIIYKFL